MAETQEIDATTFLEIVAGIRCPCTHLVSEHSDVDGTGEGAVCDECMVEGCGCQGLVDDEVLGTGWNA